MYHGDMSSMDATNQCLPLSSHAGTLDPRASDGTDSTHGRGRRVRFDIGWPRRRANGRERYYNARCFVCAAKRIHIRQAGKGVEVGTVQVFGNLFNAELEQERCEGHNDPIGRRTERESGYGNVGR